MEQEHNTNVLVFSLDLQSLDSRHCGIFVNGEIRCREQKKPKNLLLIGLVGIGNGECDVKRSGSLFWSLSVSDRNRLEQGSFQPCHLDSVMESRVAGTEDHSDRLRREVQNMIGGISKLGMAVRILVRGIEVAMYIEFRAEAFCVGLGDWCCGLRRGGKERLRVVLRFELSLCLMKYQA